MLIPRRCGVLGDPIAHSLSPVLHRAAYDVLGLDWTYDAVRVPAGGLAPFVAGLDESWRGLSLTMPLKREAFALATSVSARATLAGSANTLVLAGDGVLADNTDLPGAVAALGERGVSSVARVVVLGAGATAASVGLAACELGARWVTLLAREASRASETVEVLRRHPSFPDVTVGDLAGSDPVAADLLVSTVPVSAQTPDLVGRLAGVPAVFDVVYDPWPTPLAASAGHRVLVSGLDLLVHQAALQLELFTGLDAPLATMRAAGERALAQRPGVL